MQKNLLFLKALFLVLFFSAGAFASSLADTYGFSASGIAKGNAMTASVNDWSSVYYNMAGLGKTSHLKGIQNRPEKRSMSLAKKGSSVSKSGGSSETYLNELSFSFMYTAPQMTIDIPQRFAIPEGGGDPVYLKTNGDQDLNFGATVIGLAIDLNLIYKMPSIISSSRLGVGAGMSADLSAAKVNDIDLKTHNFLRYGREAQKAVILAGAGFGFLRDMFGVGFGINASFSGEGKVNMADVQVTEQPQSPDAQAQMDLKISPSVLVGVYFSAGRVSKILEGLEFGASFRQDSALEIDPFGASAITETGDINMSMGLAIFDYYTPHIITAGASYTKWGLTASFDLEIQLWSKYRVSSVFKEYYNGQDGKPSLPSMEDIFIPKIGVEYRFFDWLSVMGGYYLQPSFVPDSASNGIFNFLDNTKHVLSAGAEFDLPRIGGLGGPVVLTASYQLQLLVERQINKLDPMSYNPSYAYGGSCHTFIFGAMLKL